MSNDVSTLPRIATHEMLLCLGFTEDPSVMSDTLPGLSFDFGNFKLSASHQMNRWFKDVVMLSGVLTTERSIALVECEIPLEIESVALGVAWVTYCLDSHANNEIFLPRIPVAWLTEGRQSRHLLPWEKASAAHEARPRCYVPRDWAKVGLRSLAELLTSADEAAVIFQFDGEILIIRSAGKLVSMPASGKPWLTRYSLGAELLRNLPRRLLRNEVEFSVSESVLTIGNRRYPGIIAIEAEG